MPPSSWPFLEPDLPTILAAEAEPIRALARGDAAAVILRQALPRAECESLIRHLISQGLMFDSNDPRVDETALSSRVFDRYLGAGLNPDGSRRKRIDIGASLGNYGDDPDEFFRRAAETHELFAKLFTGRANPIDVIYGHLQRLVGEKRVTTAYEPDGRRYGPAIFRIHYGGFTYGPHFDSVRNRERRTNYAVYQYDTQLAGVLCLQNATRGGVSAQTILHRQFWNPQIDAVLKAGRFHEYAAERRIEHARVDLGPGDLYFFNTGLIHEVPGVEGDLPRVVLATFIGYSEVDREVMVWS
ncbi:MAG TPA: hypothetical protein VML55_09925 [Planctomycetaceae bacterium]|nr:hypothetical protein [Planctomycetaceae bacterium]